MSEQFAIISAKALRDTRLTNLQIRILCVISTFADADGRCWPLQETIALFCNCTREAVARNLDSLRKYGYIETVRHRGACTYFVNYDFRNDKKVIPESQQMCPENHNRCDSEVTYNNNKELYTKNKKEKEKEKELSEPFPVTEADLERWTEIERQMNEEFTPSEMAFIRAFEFWKDYNGKILITSSNFCIDKAEEFDFARRFAALENCRGLEFEVLRNCRPFLNSDRLLNNKTA